MPGPGNVLIPVHPDPELMRAIAAETHARTFTANQLSSVFGELSASIGKERRSREITSWFLVAAAAALVAAVALGRLLAGSLSS